MRSVRVAASSTFRSCAVLVAAGGVAFAAGCGSGSTGAGGSGVPQIQATSGKELFQKAGCVSCHKLAAAGGSSSIGPNLDDAKPGHDEVVRKVTNGDGRMPAFKGRLSTTQINTLADYIVAVAGK